MLTFLLALSACQPDPAPPASSSGGDSDPGADTMSESDSGEATTPLLLNELLASNSSYGKDSDGSSPDWIELYNAGDEPIALGDYALSDGSEDVPWSLPDEALAPGGYRLFWASGEGSGRHTDFKLSADGETVTLLGPQGEVIDRVTYPRQRTDISYGRLEVGDWYAFETPTPEAANSTRPIMPTPTFSMDGGFSGGGAVEILTHPEATLSVTIDGSDPGDGGLPYDGPIALGVSEEVAGEDGEGVWTFSSDPGLLVRHDGSDPNFEWEIAEGTLRVRMTREDAVQRLYLPLEGGPYGNTSTFHIRARFRILQAAAASVELGFLSSTDSNITDNLVGLDFYDADRGVSGYMGQAYGTCSGEAVQGNTWYVAEYSGRATDPTFTLTLLDGTGTKPLDQCTITTGGTGGELDVIGFANEDRSAASTIEEVEFDWVTWAIDEALPPDPASSQEPVRVVRAIAQRDGWAPSEIATRTFLEDGPGALPTLSLVLDPDDLWDDEAGIYANPQERGADWERAGSLELYPLEGEGFTAPVGVRIHGEGSRGSAKQSFRILFDAAYGGSHLRTPLFGEQEDARYTTLVLGGGSNDSSSAPQGDHYADVWTLIRDAAATDLYQSLAPVVIPPPLAARLYLNGEPWGIYMAKVRVDADFIEEETGHSDIDLIKNLEEIDAGSDEHWRETLGFFATANFTQAAALAEAEERVDVQWMTEYALVNGWASNHDWPFNNSYVYREQGGAVPWTWIPWDTDACWGSDSGKPFDYDGTGLMRDIEPLSDLVRGSEAYPAQIARTWARMYNDMASSDRLHSIVDARAAELRGDVAFETDRWGSSPEVWELNIDRMHSYVDERDEHFWGQIARDFAPHPGGWLSVEVEGQGTVTVEEIEVTDGWTGRFFGDMGLDIVATPGSGWRFEGWSGAVSASDPATTMSLDGDAELRATFLEE